MAQPANMGPYIENLRLEQRRRELRAHRFDDLAGSADYVMKLMFALDERRQARAKEKLETMHTIMETWGPDRMPQGLLNEYGSAIDTLAGGKMVPRDLQGNVLPPEPSIEQEGRRRLAQMPPEQRKKFFDRMLGMEPTAAQQATIDRQKLMDEEHRRHDQIMESIAWAHARGTSSASAWRNEGSMYTMGPDARPRLAEPGDPVMTRQDLLDYEKLNRQAIQQDVANMRRKKLRKEIEEDPATGRMITSTIVALSRMKEGPVKARLFEGFWEHHWRKYEQAHTGSDPGPAPKSRTLRDRAIASWHSIFGSNDLPEVEFKPGKASRSAAEPPTVSPEDEVKHLEGIFGAQP